jgi:type II secretory pathway pseudopilin PulG
MNGRRTGAESDAGYAMAALLVGLAVMSVMVSLALPVWRTMIKREKEEELVFRGRQYVRAVELFQRKNPGAYPPTIDFLVEQRYLRRKYKDPMTEAGEFRVLYQGMFATDAPRAGEAPGRGAAPTGRGDSGPTQGRSLGGSIGIGAGGSSLRDALGRSGSVQFSGTVQIEGRGVVGVASRSTDSSLRIYNGRTVYSDWQFAWIPSAAQPGGAGGRGVGGAGVGGLGGGIYTPGRSGREGAAGPGGARRPQAGEPGRGGGRGGGGRGGGPPQIPR